MGLSSDPEKRAAQLRNLQGGWPTAATRHGIPHDQATPPAGDSDTEPVSPPPEPPAGGVSVLPYDEPATHPSPAPSPEPGPDDPGPADPAEDEETNDEERAPGGGGFWDGFLGR